MVNHHNQEEQFNQELTTNQNIDISKTQNLASNIDPDAPTQIEFEQEEILEQLKEVLSAELSNESPPEIAIEPDNLSSDNEVKKIQLPQLPSLPKKIESDAQILEAEIDLNQIPLIAKIEDSPLEIKIENPTETPVENQELSSPVTKKKNLSFNLIKGLISGMMIPLIVIGAGIIVALLALNSLKSSEQLGTFNPTEIQETQAPNQNNPPIQIPQIQVFWLENNSNQISLSPQSITIDQSAAPQDNLRSALERLLAGVDDPNYASAIPQGTKLLDLRVVGDNIQINLSKEFTTGGGTASMTGRLAQLLYTATSLNPNAQITLRIENELLEVLGGEGLMVDQPLTRAKFETNFPL